LVGQLVADAKVALALADAMLRGERDDQQQARASTKLREARDLLAELLLQDVEEKPGDGGGPVIKQGTAADRIVSTTDPESRHGRKSSSQRFDGHKAAIAVDSEDGVVLATDVIPGNAPDKQGVREQVEEAAEAAGQPVKTVIADTAYGDLGTRDALAEDGVEVVAKVQPAGHRNGLFSVEDFEIDMASRTARCPAGKLSVRASLKSYGSGPRRMHFFFSRSDCMTCPLRGSCTTSKLGFKTITVHEDYDRLRDLRDQQRTPEFKQAYRQRVIVEHRIARLVQLGIRTSRFFCRAKTALQVALAAAVANLTLAMHARAPDGHQPLAAIATTMAFLALLITFVGGLSPTSLVFLPALILIAIASGRQPPASRPEPLGALR
jgi:hypothetical protein